MDSVFWKDSLYAATGKRDLDCCSGWLVQLADGNRLDLHVDTLDYAKQVMEKDSLCHILLDKDGELGKTQPDDSSYWEKLMDEAAFSEILQ